MQFNIMLKLNKKKLVSNIFINFIQFLISQGTEIQNLLLTVCRLSCRKIEVDDPIALFFFLCNNFFHDHFSKIESHWTFYVKTLQDSSKHTWHGLIRNHKQILLSVEIFLIDAFTSQI